MRMSVLIQHLVDALTKNGDLEVLLTVDSQEGQQLHGNCKDVTVEDDHSDGALFVRISGDDEE